MTARSVVSIIRLHFTTDTADMVLCIANQLGTQGFHAQRVTSPVFLFEREEEHVLPRFHLICYKQRTTLLTQVFVAMQSENLVRFGPISSHLGDRTSGERHMLPPSVQRQSPHSHHLPLKLEYSSKQPRVAYGLMIPPVYQHWQTQTTSHHCLVETECREMVSRRQV